MEMDGGTDRTGELHSAIAKATSQRLHDAAQPLTVLQGLLEFTLEQGQTVEEYRECLQSALTEMARVTACFENVRQLVRLQHPAEDVGDFSFSERAGKVFEQYPGVVFQRLDEPEPDLVRASPARVLQAISLLLTTAGVHDTEVCVSIEFKDSNLEVRIVSGDWKVSDLALCRLIAGSAGGELLAGETFDSIVFRLPKALPHHSTQKKGLATQCPA